MPRTAASEITSLLVGSSIRRAREDAGMTQAELADRMHASPPYVSGLETGKSNMTIGQLAAVADALHAELHIELRVPDLPAEPSIPTS